MTRLLPALPQGTLLGQHTWQRRHRLLLGLLAAHVPGLAVVGVVNQQPLRHVAVEVTLVAAIALGSLLLRSSQVLRACAATLGLALCSAILVHLTGGLIEAHFHYFAVLSLVALYEDWRPFLLAVGFVILGHGTVGVLDPESIYNHPAALQRPWLWAGVHGAFVIAASIGPLILWKTHERDRQDAQRHYQDPYEGERALVTQLRQAEQLKSELIAIVSHEFRTPLTAILGYAKTLTARWDGLEPEQMLRCADVIERQSIRLSRLLSGLLAASGETLRSPGDSADLTGVAAAVVDELEHFPGDSEHAIVLDVPAGLTVAVRPDIMQQILVNLLDNARKFAASQTSVRLSARRDGDHVRLEVANLGDPIPGEDLDRIFEPFVQSDSSDSRRHGGIGLGLYIVRKLVGAYDGIVSVHNAPPCVVVIVKLPVSVGGLDGGLVQHVDDVALTVGERR